MDSVSTTDWPQKRRINVRDLRAAKERGARWAMLTSYDALTARIFDDAGARALLVGDTAAMTVLGHDSTLPIKLDELISMAAAVVRGTSHSLVIGDLPFGSYQTSAAQAVDSSTRYFKEAGVQAVKLEGGRAVAAQVSAITNAGMPVMGHIGLTPQSVNALGGYRVQGRGSAAEELLADAKALESAGAFAVVLEAVPTALAQHVTESLSIPTVGIGAGAACDAQVLVWQDMAGLTTGPAPKFVKRYANLHDVLAGAATEFVSEVAAGIYPAPEHGYE